MLDRRLRWTLCCALLSTVGCRCLRASAPTKAAPRWEYTVALGTTLDDLQVLASFPPGSGDVTVAEAAAAPFVRDLAVDSGSTWRSASWPIACDGGCRIRYGFALRRAADTLDDPFLALADRDVVVTPASTWLVRPEQDSDAELLIRVERGSARFATGLRAVGPDTYRLSAVDLGGASLSVFGAHRRVPMEAAGAHVEVIVGAGQDPIGDAQLAHWIAADADVVRAELGAFPVDRLFVAVVRDDAAAHTFGLTVGGGGAGILLRVPTDLEPSSVVAGDWVLPHEMIHVATPRLDADHRWLSEGLATYVEPLLRVRAGFVDAEKFWRDLVEGLPRGLPEAGDEGLDRTHTWGRTYWGGALFCLLADVGIRERTKGRASLDDVLRAVHAAGGNVLSRWSLARWLEVGDAATGTRVLHELHERLGARPGEVDLAALFRRLGVAIEEGRVRYDENAPLASIRRALTVAIARAP
ncbi:MAG: hypothetical protein HYV09_16605 [Deltaproteobacteria bacterium]|nr:hypothetical protein [Deltaproteobacteria bacterium]